jgi:hypothetical protein
MMQHRPLTRASAGDARVRIVARRASMTARDAMTRANEKAGVSHRPFAAIA